MSLSSQFDPFHEYEGIEFEHHGAGWRSDPDRFMDVPGGGVPRGFGAFGDVPFTHGMLHLPGDKRIAVEGRWNKLQTPAARNQLGQSTVQQHGGVEQAFGPVEVPERTWDDFRFHALAEVEDAYDAPFMDIGVQSVVGPHGAPERPEGGGTVLSGRPVGVHLPEGVGTPAGYYPVEVGPTHSKVHTEGWWRGVDADRVDPLARDEKEVRRWAQDPGGESQGPGAPEFGTTVTERVRRGDLQSYRRGSRRLAQQSVSVSPIEQLTDPAGLATLSSTTSDFYDFYTAELDRYMHHLREGGDGWSSGPYFERGTHGQDMPDDDDAEDVTNIEADNVEEVVEQRKADPDMVEFLREQIGSRKGRPSTKDTRPDQSLGEPELTDKQKEEDQKIYQQKRDKIISKNREDAKTKAAKKIDRETRVAAAVRRVRNAKRREARADKKTYDEEGTGSQDFDQRMEKFDDMWPSEGSLTHGDPRLDKHARTMWAAGGLRPGTDLEDMRQEVTRRYPRAFPN